MTGKLDKFYVDYGVHGAKIMARSHLLTPGCLADGEIDRYINALKDDLDACAREMKRRAKSERQKIHLGTERG